MIPKNTINNLKEIKVDAAYGKKKHFNAADRKQGYYSKINFAMLGANLLVDFVLIYLTIYTGYEWLKYITLIVAFIGTFLTAFQIHSNFCKISEGHRSIGNQYLKLYKKCGRLESYIADGALDDKDIVNEIEELSDEIHSINVAAESFPTNDADYQAAKEGIQQGEESYTEEELSL